LSATGEHSKSAGIISIHCLSDGRLDGPNPGTKTALLCAAILWVPAPALAAAPAQAAAAPGAVAAETFPIINMHHTSWTAKDGAPTIVLAMA
jgi:hypothetical protein